jgi:hypothetical protein
LPCGTEEGHHLLLSAGLEWVPNNPELGLIFDAVDGFNQKYGQLQLWFTEDLNVAVASKAISPQVKNSDEAKLIIRQGPIDTCCGG